MLGAMRLFLALDPPPAALDEVERAIAPMRHRLPELRWTARETQHLTLVFLGEVGEDRVARLKQLVGRKLLRHHPLRLELRGVGTFPRSHSRAKVLWTGVHGDLPALHRLQAALTKAARDAHLSVEHRRYAPHLTLVRCKAPTDLEGKLGPLQEFAGTAWQAAEVRLVHSNLGAAPRYTTVATWDLSSS